MSEWKQFIGSDEQIAEINNCEHGYLLRYKNFNESDIIDVYVRAEYLIDVTHYLICNPHPLADMIIRQAQTGQPVFIKLPPYMIGGLEEYWNETRDYEINIDNYPSVITTTTPDWNIPNAEYSFTLFGEVDI